MNKLQALLNEAEQEHKDMWAVAIAESKAKMNGLYNCISDAMAANPNYGTDYFWKDENGYWRCF